MPNRGPSEHTYRPAWWVPGRHGQTLWGRIARRHTRLALRLERLSTADGDQLELRRLAAPGGDLGAPHLLFLHGLEGTVRSHYVSGLFEQAHARGWSADLLVFRGCGDAPNTARRFYHSGETSDLAAVLGRLIGEAPGREIVLAGVSLGGNVLLKYLGELGDAVPQQLRAAAALSVPYDLARGARYISRGFSRVYERYFLGSLRAKALAKLERYPGLFDPEALERARTIWDFDEVVTAPVHGFRDASDYYDRSSALRYLRRIRVPTLLLSAYDDPFLPAAVLEEVRAAAGANSFLHPEFVSHGGHVGFVSGVVPWRPFYYGEWRVVDFLAKVLSASERGAARASGIA